MSKINITKKDIVWSFLATFFNIGAGIITLPLILNRLSADEIGMNYLMITVSTMVALLDFGFAPQFARNITYVFAGAHEIKKEGVAEAHETINYNLVARMIGVAKMVYGILAVISLIVMLTGGTWYIWDVTDGFTNVKNSLLIWIIFSFSVFFNVYYFYYTSLLTGRGLVMQSKKATIIQRCTYLVLTYIFLLLGWRLLGVVIANLISPFVGRFLCYFYFYDKELKENLKPHQPTKQEKTELFKTIWYNSKKLGLVYIGSYAINKLGMFFAGLFLSLEEVASYGLMVQIGGLISGISMTYNGTEQPRYSAFRTEKKYTELINLFAKTMNVYYILMFLGFVCLIILGPWVLKIIGSNAQLPTTITIIVFGIMILLESNTSEFATLIITDNKIPFVESSLLTGIAICIGTYIELKYTDFGILGIIIVQIGCSMVYSYWKWTYVICKEFKISLFKFLRIGLCSNWNQGLMLIKSMIHKFA